MCNNLKSRGRRQLDSRKPVKVSDIDSRGDVIRQFGQQPDKIAGGTYFGLGRSEDARPGSELGYAQRSQCAKWGQTANLDASGKLCMVLSV